VIRGCSGRRHRMPGVLVGRAGRVRGFGGRAGSHVGGVGAPADQQRDRGQGSRQHQGRNHPAVARLHGTGRLRAVRPHGSGRSRREVPDIAPSWAAQLPQSCWPPVGKSKCALPPPLLRYAA
jgi:hypothetical protein